MQAQSDLKQQEENKSALGYMLIAVLLFSAFPFTFAIGNASAAPFLFVALMNFSAVITGLGFLVWFQRTKRENQTAKKTLRVIYSKIYTKAFFWLTIARFETIFFAMSLAYINVAVATILAGMQPLIVAILIERLFKEHGRYEKITKEKWFLFALAFIGAGFVVASQSENFGEIVVDLLNQGAVIGILLVLLSGVIGGITDPNSLKLGNDISEKTGGCENDKLFFSTAVLVVTWFVGFVAFIILGYTSNESFSDINIYPAIIYGSFAFGGGVLSRFAYIKTTNLGITAIRYLTPIVTLVWLGLASLIDIPHFDWLVIGAVAIIVANLLLNFKADDRLAYKTLVVALWVFGAIIYLTDGYQQIISLEFASTIFILILAFRVDRLVRRTTEEESNTFALFRRLEFLVGQKIIDKKALTYLLEIDKQKNMQGLKKAYEDLKNQLINAKKLINKSSRDGLKELAEIEIQVDELAHSKQQGAHFGEIVAIGFIGALIVGGLLFFSETGATGGSVFFVDMTSLVIASISVFLFFNIIDLENDRKDPILKSVKHGKPTIYGVKFDDTKNRTMEQWVSVVVSLAIIAAYGWLLWAKAVG